MKCSLCEKVFTKIYELNIHKKEHAHKCDLCEEEFRKEDTLKQHVIDHVQCNKIEFQ